MITITIAIHQLSDTVVDVECRGKDKDATAREKELAIRVRPALLAALSAGAKEVKDFTPGNAKPANN